MFYCIQFSSVAQSFPTLQSHGLHHARPPCPSPTLGVYSNSRPLRQWCHPTISSSVVPSPPALNLSQPEGLFKWVSSSQQVAKVLKFQFQHQSFQWYSGLISFRMDWLDLLAVQGTLKSLLQDHSCCIRHSIYSVFGRNFVWRPECVLIWNRFIPDLLSSLSYYGFPSYLSWLMPDFAMTFHFCFLIFFWWHQEKLLYPVVSWKSV